MGRNIEGVRLIIIDEVSMISCEALNVISSHFRDARVITIADIDERKRLQDVPFGGIHVLYVGDFYQLPPISSTPLYDPSSKKPEAISGRNIWSLIEHYVELDVNHRLQDSDEGTKILASCLKTLRIGQVSNRILSILNCRLHGNPSNLMDQIHPNSVWLSSTNEKVD
jgi:hypothetical protein